MFQQTATDSGRTMIPTHRETPWLSSVVGIVRELGRVCQELREQAGDAKPDRFERIRIHMAWGRGASDRTLRGFETGTKASNYPDDIVEAYSKAYGVPVLTICREAVERLEAEEDNPGLTMPLTDADLEPEKRSTGSAGKAPVAKRKRAGGGGRR